MLQDIMEIVIRAGIFLTSPPYRDELLWKSNRQKACQQVIGESIVVVLRKRGIFV